MERCGCCVVKERCLLLGNVPDEAGKPPQLVHLPVPLSCCHGRCYGRCYGCCFIVAIVVIGICIDEATVIIVDVVVVDVDVVVVIFDVVVVIVDVGSGVVVVLQATLQKLISRIPSCGGSCGDSGFRSNGDNAGNSGASRDYECNMIYLAD